MAQFFELIRKTSAPQSGVISVLNYYKDNSTPINLSVDGASYMKVWINQTAVGTDEDEEMPSNWSAYQSTWTPNFSEEGTNYVHAIFMDSVGNKTAVINSIGTIFDKTAPVVTAVLIASGSDVVVERDVIVRVTASDTTSGILKTVLSGDLDASSQTEFMWSDTDRTNGYKDCTVKLTSNTDPSHRETKTVYAIATDRADNTGERNSDNIVLYTGGVDPVMIVKDEDDKVIGKHYGKNKINIELQILTGITDLIVGYKLWGDFNDTLSPTGKTEPSEWTTWEEGETIITEEDKYLTSADGEKEIKSKVRFKVASLAGTVPTKADLPSSANDGDIYKVTADADYEGESTAYRYNGEATEFEFYGYMEGGDANAWKNIEIVEIHHSDAEPSIVLTTNKNIISEKEGYNSCTLSAALTTTCNICEYKAVAYASMELALAGTPADATNIDLYGTEEKASGTSWQPELLESKLALALSGDGNKFIVVYAKNLCEKWGRSNVLTVSIDTQAPVGSITVQPYYNQISGFTSSAIDSGSSVAKMRAWVDSSAGTETPPATSVQYDYAPNVTTTQVDWSGKIQGNCYVHIEFVDAVGNKGVKHSGAFVYDDVAPVGCSVSGPQLTNTSTVVVNLSATDATSGMGQVKLYGDIQGKATAEQAEWQDYTSTANITLSNGDGDKVINALFKDKAGNIITSAVSCTIKLDTEGFGAAITLYRADDSEPLDPNTNMVDFRAHITAADESDVEDILEYKVWGNITEAATEEVAEWKPFVAEDGKIYMSLPLSLTTGDGLKYINVKLKDKAGNPGTKATASVTLDTTAPVITVSGVDYNEISDKHEARLTSSGEVVPNTYFDKMTFKFSSDSKLQEFKVCVNEIGQQPSTAIAIGMDHGSVNMSGSTVEANTEVSCVIMDADFKATDAVDEEDGTYEVIVYGKNLAGTWSEAHVLVPVA